MLDATVQGIVDAAIDGSFDNISVDSVSEAAKAVREPSVTALLLSPSVASRYSLLDIHALVTKSPTVTAVAVLADDWPTSHDALLRLGACGVRRVVNLAEREGWNRLRDLVARTGGEGGLLITREILRAVEGSSPGVQRFFAELIRLAPDTVTVRALGRTLEVLPSTLMSRFFRARLPAPKIYLAMTRLLYAAYYLEEPKASVAATANALHFSSPQSFGRHVRLMLGLTAREFRKELPFPKAVNHCVERLIQPYRQALCTFDPLGIPVTAALRTGLE